MCSELHNLAVALCGVRGESGQKLRSLDMAHGVACYRQHLQLFIHLLCVVFLSELRVILVACATDLAVDVRKRRELIGDIGKGKESEREVDGKIGRKYTPSTVQSMRK